MREMFGGEMDAKARNYRRIAAQLGLKDINGVRDCFYALRSKGGRPEYRHEYDSARAVGGPPTTRPQHLPQFRHVPLGGSKATR
jgi:hypothetical protein